MCQIEKRRSKKVTPRSSRSTYVLPRLQKLRHFTCLSDLPLTRHPSGEIFPNLLSACCLGTSEGISLHSPGTGREAWSANIAAKDHPLGWFWQNGLNVIQVALIPSNGSAICLKNPKLIQAQLSRASPLYRARHL